MPNSRVSEVALYEVYIDLWGMTPNWIATIQDRLLGFAEPRKGDDCCEAYTNPACIAVRFRSSDKKRVQKVKAIFSRLYNLAKKTTLDPKKVCYCH